MNELHNNAEQFDRKTEVAFKYLQVRVYLLPVTGSKDGCACQGASRLPRSHVKPPSCALNNCVCRSSPLCATASPTAPTTSPTPLVSMPALQSQHLQVARSALARARARRRTSRAQPPLHTLPCTSAGPFAGIYAVWRCTCVQSKSDVPTWILVVGGAGIVLVSRRWGGCAAGTCGSGGLKVQMVVQDCLEAAKTPC